MDVGGHCKVTILFLLWSGKSRGILKGKSRGILKLIFCVNYEFVPGFFHPLGDGEVGCASLDAFGVCLGAVMHPLSPLGFEEIFHWTVDANINWLQY